MKAIIFVFYVIFVTISAVIAFHPKIPENRHWKDNFEKLHMKVPPSSRPDREHMLWKAVLLAYLERNYPKKTVEKSHYGDYSGDEEFVNMQQLYQKMREERKNWKTRKFPKSSFRFESFQ